MFLVVLLLAMMAFRGTSHHLPAEDQATQSTEVVVAKGKIEPGQPLEKAPVALERRPVNTLPADAITSLESLKNKIAAGPIPAGYPLALALLADPVVVPAVTEKVDEAPPEDPIETLFREIESETVSVPLTFSSNPPKRGARMAVTLSNTRGETIIVVEESWVASSSGREAVLRLDPTKALLLQSARSLGNFGFIEIPVDGPSPYAGKAVNSIEELKERLAGRVVEASAEKKPTTKMKGYAWISGEGLKYGIDQDGQIKVMDGNE
ncbi:MAG: hypothetical protein K1X83_00955 [Oligoflexia bacterium]|nr:hypothetical protein [Oligoflexia bacterium]